jgi:hypothetical protein
MKLGRQFAGVLALLVVLLGAGAATSAQAAAAPGLTLEVRDGTELVNGGVVVVLTNRGDSPCQVSATSLGTLSVTSLRQGGPEIRPESMPASLWEGPEQTILDHLQTLAPGATARVLLNLAPHESGSALATVLADVAGGNTMALRYPIRADQPLELALAYTLPVKPEAGAPACAGAAGAGKVSTGGSALVDRPARTWMLVGLGVISVTLVVGAVLLVRQRRRRRAGAVLLILLLACTPTAVGHAPPASAEIIVPPDLADAYASCVPMLKADPANILPAVNAPGVKVQLWANPGGSSFAASSTDETGKFEFADIAWDLNRFLLTYTAEEQCAILYHELAHVAGAIANIPDRGYCVLRDRVVKIPVDEVNATRKENLMRRALGLPEREAHGGVPLPEGECLDWSSLSEGELALCGLLGPRGGTRCSSAMSDPHLLTYDGLDYDFQAIGDFVLTADTARGFAVQTRMVPIRRRTPGSPQELSMTTGLALDVDGDRFEIALAGHDGWKLTLNGHRSTARPVLGRKSTIRFPQGGKADLAPGYLGPRLTVTWPDGSTLQAGGVRGRFLQVTTSASARHRGRLTGLLGDGDSPQDPSANTQGDWRDDLIPRGGGTAITKPSHATLYPDFADSWRVRTDESLFAKPAGRPDRSYPRAPRATPVPAELQDRAAAEAICRQSGVTDPPTLADCIVDVAATGDPVFAESAAQAQATQVNRERQGQPGAQAEPEVQGTEYAGETMTDVAPTQVRIDRPGDTQKLTFEGHAGESIYVSVTASTLDLGCGVLRILAPTGKPLNTGCIIDKVGGIDTTRLPATGRYQVVLDPGGNTTGVATIGINSAPQRRGKIEPGSPTPIKITKPGETLTLSFTGRAGQAVVASVLPASTLPDQCSPLRLTFRGKELASSCVIGGRGHSAPARLPGNGRYDLVLNPERATTGNAVLLISAGEQELRSGETTTLRVTRPGAAAFAGFTVRAGQTARIALVASDSRVDCDLALLDPVGKNVASGCLTGTREGGFDATRLRRTGRYTLVIPPDKNLKWTGTVQARLTLS